MPLFHSLDTFIERGSYSFTMGKAMVTKYKHQPAHIQNYLFALRDDLSTHSILDYIAKSSNPVLKNQYDLLISAYLGEQGLIGVHTLKVYGYMKINFRNGRLVTNGGHDGTATIATEPQRHIYDDFAQADLERLGDYRPIQQYATTIGMKVHKDKAAIIDLDVSKTALQFQPGDHCAIRPENSSEAINSIIRQYKLDPAKKVALNGQWKAFFGQHLNRLIDEIELGELLKHADLTVLQGVEFHMDALKPLAPRYYSVATMHTSPGAIRLTVGMHNNGDGKSIGLCSTYLMSDAPKFAIDCIPARHCHLPKSKETPVLMFAAGTGISPFMGFIDERTQYSDKSKNMLFYSTPSMETFYHQDELWQAVYDNKLDLSVIFSRGTGYDSGSFGDEEFETTSKYKGKPVDQLIEEQAKKVADLIVNQNAQIYICGNPGFADTVRAAVIKALSAHSTIENPSAYVDTMIADFRFNSDVYAATNYNQQYPSIQASEVAVHNKPDDCWGVINGSVYNLTRFIHTHPGGQKIVLVNGGMDMSGDYNYIKHNQRPQIEAQLQQYKIGVLATTVLHEAATITLHGNSKKFVEALTEMENTLRNNTTHDVVHEDAYLWREVYSVFVDGSLASYRKPGSGGAGSLNDVLGPLLKELCHNVNYPVQSLEEEYLRLMQNAGDCGQYIRQSTLGSLSEEQLRMKKKIFDMVLQQTFKFIGEVKSLALDVLKEMEVHGDGYNKELIEAKLENIVKAVSLHSGVLKHVTSQLPKLDKTVPLVKDISSG
ncbi:MAG: cytochrome b5 domain-containing protein [Legionella sp.]